ncbi:survival protein sure-like phosphatase/nucleotidase [Rhypophila decipiens]|uniref:Survival protein sure-like phosphatase/nucleotidase n=1 Tax=Rhypophila decipiens TaxID=261697 RepID=A0AAN6Y1N6_9PEZI|nr:survival protein sure-like phosphatase/nucleotidase [Rhypophila decipiens]
MMHFLTLLTLAPLCRARNPRIIFSNDDGLGSLNLYEFYHTLNSSGYFDLLVSAPCDDKSGTASRDTSDPEGDLRTPAQGECRFNSTHGAPGKRHGHGIKTDGSEDPYLYWVNGYPATSMRLGIDNFSSDAFSRLGSNLKPELALTGINYGSNGDSTASISGTVGAARYAAKRGIPAIGFSGSFGRHVGWNDPELGGKNSDALVVAKTYAGLATSLVLQIIKAADSINGTYLPKGTLMNVNFPDATLSSTGCNDTSKFKWVLAYTKLTNVTVAPDVRQGNCSRIPTEGEVLSKDNQKKCLISVSMVNAEDLGVASVKDYTAVLESLKGWGSWACL